MFDPPKVGDFISAYKPEALSPDILQFKAIIIEVNSSEFTTTVLYSHKKYNYKPLDIWTFTLSDMKNMGKNCKRASRAGYYWISENGT